MTDFRIRRSGKSILDVGLAQARQPLNTQYHYFEIEIIDPGRELLHRYRTHQKSNVEFHHNYCSIV